MASFVRTLIPVTTSVPDSTSTGVSTASTSLPPSSLLTSTNVPTITSSSVPSAVPSSSTSTASKTYQTTPTVIVTTGTSLPQPSTGGLSTRSKWIIGTTVTIIPIIILLIICFLIYRQRRQLRTISEKKQQLPSNAYYPDDYDTPRPKARPLTWPKPMPENFSEDLEKAAYTARQKEKPKSVFTGSADMDKRLPSPESDVYVVHMVFEDPENGRNSVVSCEGYGKERKMVVGGYTHGDDEKLGVPKPVYDPSAPTPPPSAGGGGWMGVNEKIATGGEGDGFTPGHKKGKPSLTLQTQNLGRPPRRK